MRNDLYFNTAGHEESLRKILSASPWYQIDLVEPGSVVWKHGNRTGITAGVFIGQGDVSFKEGNKTVYVSNAVLINSTSQAPSTLSGDSGSVYYLVRGEFRYPLAVHRCSAVYETKTVHGRSQNFVSTGTPFSKVMRIFTDLCDTSTSPEWFFRSDDDRVVFTLSQDVVEGSKSSLPIDDSSAVDDHGGAAQKADRLVSKGHPWDNEYEPRWYHGKSNYTSNKLSEVKVTEGLDFSAMSQTIDRTAKRPVKNSTEVVDFSHEKFSDFFFQDED